MLHVIPNNAPSHRSNATEQWFEDHDRLEVVFQPKLPRCGHGMERIWAQLHATGTQHHRFDDLEQLVDPVDRFVKAVEPFSGSDPGMTEAA